MMDLLHISELRPGANGNNPQAPNAANYDESKANPYPVLPDPLILKNGKKVTSSVEWWKLRRPEIIEDFEREVYGRVPAKTPKVDWVVTSTVKETRGDYPVIVKQLDGHVDNSEYPAVEVQIHATLTTPAKAVGKVPVVLQFGFGFPPPRRGLRRPAGPPTLLTGPSLGQVPGLPAGSPASTPVGGQTAGPPRPPGAAPGGPQSATGWQQLVLAKGWGYAVLTPNSIQADSGAGLTKGIIGLVNLGQPRKLDDWGVLRAWAWGASRVLDYFQTDKNVDSTQVAIEGHSRYGKAALVTMAFDTRFAAAYVSSSGEGGAKLHRRNAGELVENVAGEGEYHWMAGNFIKYAGPLNAGDLPVDSHELIALCAPRPVFLSAGNVGDAWVDARGSFLAAVASGPVYKLLGKRDLGANEFPAVEVALVDGDLAYRQHNLGHTDAPNWPTFLVFASRYMHAPTQQSK